MRLASIPLPDEANPFGTLLYRALHRQGVELLGEGSLRPRWLLRHRRTVDILHVHWAEYLFLRRSTLASLGLVVRTAARLLAARLLGYRVWWTVHNLRPHDPGSERLARAGMQAVALLAHDVFVHSETTRDEVRDLFHRTKRVHLAPLGNYIGWYPEGLGRGDARARLGLAAEGMTFLLLGRLSPYKGVTEAITAFGRMAEPHDRLVIAGLAKDDGLHAAIVSAAETDARLHFHDDIVPDDELQTFFAASDVVLLPFRHSTTSASLLLALGFGRPVIASRVGNAAEVVDAASGLLVAPGDASALADAMRRVRTVDREAMGAAARRRAASFTWDDAAAILAATVQPSGRSGRGRSSSGGRRADVPAGPAPHGGTGS